MAAGSSLAAHPRLANPSADVHDDRAPRMRYIEAYLHFGDDSRRESTLNHLPRVVQFYDKSGGRPTWAGPNIERDIDLFRQRHLAESEPFDKDTSILARMYGLGLKELEFLARNPNPRERETQLETLELYHMLKFFLGAANVADLSEQLEYCFYALKRSRSAWMEPPSAGFDPRNRQKRERDATRDRRREFQIAKIMADRLWEQFLVEGRRVIPVFLRRQLLPNGRRREGDWHKLSRDEQFRLLGGEDQYYRSHGLYHQLAREWLPSPEVPPRPFVPESQQPLDSLIHYWPLQKLSGDLSELSCKATSNFRLAVLQQEVQEVPHHVKWLWASR